MVSSQDVTAALRRVMDPELHRDVVSLGMIEDVRVDGDRVSFTLNLTTPACPLRAEMEQSVHEAGLPTTRQGEILEGHPSLHPRLHTRAAK